MSGYEQHYSHMGEVDIVTQEAVSTAFNTDFSANYDDWSKNLRLICLFTAEAARSNTVYRHCQGVIHGHTTKQYKSLWPYINNYEKTREVNGIPADKFHPLDDEYYRTAKVLKGILNL